MVGWTDSITIRAGATPLTFDGEGTIRFNDLARRITGISIGHSLSAWTTEEGYAMAVKLSENAGLPSRNPVFFMGMLAAAGPTTNKAEEVRPQDYVPLDIPVAPSSTMRVDITTILGATQTGTHDVRITIHYDAGDTPADILAAAAGRSGVAPCKGGSYGTVTALTTATETAMTGNGSTLNIPMEAKEIIGIVAIGAADTAVTQLEEMGGHVRLEFSGITDANKQEYPINGGNPNIGTEVEGGNACELRRLPMYLRCPNQEIQVSAFINALSAKTGGADYAVNLLWR